MILKKYWICAPPKPDAFVDGYCVIVGGVLVSPPALDLLQNFSHQNGPKAIT